MGNSGVIAAVITAAVAVIVALLTQVATSRRDRADRRYAARRQAIVDAQDSAVDLRTALAEYGETVRRSATIPAPPPTDVARAVQRARGRLAVAVSRVQDAAIQTAIDNWQHAAERRFLSVEEVTAAEEDAWFSYVNALAGLALRSTDGETTAGDRRQLTTPPQPPA